jgi:flagellar protein FlgJ
MSEIGLNTILSMPGPSSTEQNPGRIRDAAKQFESLLIEQMLKSARDSGSGDWTGTSEDPTGSTMTEMADQQFAQLLASNGGMGLAKMVVEGLERRHQ